MATDIINKKEQILDEVQARAEELFRSGTLFCSESVVLTINEFLGKPYDDDIVKMASGFPVGMGKSGCLCGAVSGGQMALGMVYGRTKGEPMDEKMFERAKELHDYMKNQYKSNCCRVITKLWAGNDFQSSERKELCIKITGDIARWVAKQLIEDGQIEIEDFE